MNPKFLLGAASVLFKNRKIQILLVGLQLGYLIYKSLQDKEDTSLAALKSKNEK